MLAIRDLHVYYGGIHALRGIDIDVPDGKIISLIGANGAGKCTTLKSIMGLVPKAEGHVYWDDVDITSSKTKDIVGEGIILCPEGRRIFPDLTVDENIMCGAYLRKDKEEIEKDKEWVYSLFPRLKERTWQLGATLSGGEQQMLAVARALMSKPKLLMLDEPMSAADIETSEKLNSYLVSECEKNRITLLLSTHMPSQAMNTATKILIMNNGEISEYSDISGLKNPKSDFGKKFIEQWSIL